MSLFSWKGPKYLLTEFGIHRLRSCELAKSQVENERIKLSLQSCRTTFQKLFGLAQILYLTLGSIVVILFPAIFECIMGNTVGLQEKYQFLPLMAYSVFCAVGNVFIYFSVYFDYAFRKLWDPKKINIPAVFLLSKNCLSLVVDCLIPELFLLDD